LVARVDSDGFDVTDLSPRLVAEPEPAWYRAGVADQTI
jgi:hypothetical protein